MNGKLFIATIGTFMLFCGGALTLADAFNRRDDRFRNRCIDMKRVYGAGQCLGSAVDAAPPSSASAAKLVGLPNGERTWNDLVQACQKLEDGWLTGATRPGRGPLCHVPGKSDDVEPPSP